MSIDLPAVRTLIVDHDRAICDHIQSLLEREGHHVKALHDGARLDEEMRAGGHKLLIVDLNAPKFDGVEALRRLRREDNELAVLAFVSPPFDAAMVTLKADGVEALKKPFNVDEFREVISRVMRRRTVARSPEEQIHHVIGDTIRNLRKDRDLTLKQMARRTGLSVSLLSQIERAESSASIASLYKIASALESRVQDLFGQY